MPTCWPLWGDVILTINGVVVAGIPWTVLTWEEIHIVDTMVRTKIPGNFAMKDLSLKVTIYFS
jgi:hypothetical protein